jgi:alpha-1,2-glucosyltransferase
MKIVTKYYLALLLVCVAYCTVSKYVFDKLYQTIHVVIDELFHIPQGTAYCQRNFTFWDPKITTLPGLYLMSAAVLGTYFPCNTYNLRFINLAASCINLMLFSSILRFVYGTNTYVKTIMQALNLALLPPLYFFSHVYYTDTLSLTFLLVFSRLCFTNQHKLLILVFGCCSVLMRQTNVAWIAMVFGHKVLDIFIRSSRVFGNESITNVKLSKNSLIARDVDASKLKRYYNLKDFFIALKYHVKTCLVTFFKFATLQDWLVLITHAIILLSFVAFVYYNGSIVVGDKKAHEASLHIPQILYFLLFYGIFGLPHVIIKLPSTLKLMYQNKIVIAGLANTSLLSTQQYRHMSSFCAVYMTISAIKTVCHSCFLTAFVRL